MNRRRTKLLRRVVFEVAPHLVETPGAYRWACRWLRKRWTRRDALPSDMPAGPPWMSASRSSSRRRRRRPLPEKA